MIITEIGQNHCGNTQYVVKGWEGLSITEKVGSSLMAILILMFCCAIPLLIWFYFFSGWVDNVPLGFWFVLAPAHMASVVQVAAVVFWIPCYIWTISYRLINRIRGEDPYETERELLIKCCDYVEVGSGAYGQYRSPDELQYAEAQRTQRMRHAWNKFSTGKLPRWYSPKVGLIRKDKCL